ncbi:MAG TPA: bifunctional riboflavin kinase/FAD synthetase [Aeromicrobium sp.]|nr:bifunctional riboflavin kinase/FAD synthetase [Aeromicrobium sp.]
MIWRAIDGAVTAPRESASAVTIGAFDGVHRGHQELVRRAAATGLPAVAVTFDPHPTAVFAPDHAPRRLTTVERRVELLRAAGADEVRVLAFDREMAAWSPREFIDRVLCAQLSARAVVVGANFTFGSKAAGTCDLLREAGPDAGFTVDEVALLGGPIPWSSTRVRAAIADGDMRAAADILGRPHEIEGVVSRGEQRGRELGFPTANVPVDERFAVPPDGVYAAWFVRASGERLPAATSVGTNPTFGEHERRVESYVLDRDDLDLYGESVRVEFVERLRGMDTFDGVDALLAQMARDVDAARLVLGS